MDENEQRLLIDDVADNFVRLCKTKLDGRVKSLYIFGSYAFGKVSLDRPDVNFLVVLDGAGSSDDFIKIGEVCKELASTFEGKCSVRIEFRPFRYIYPKVKEGYDVFVNPAVISSEEIRGMGAVFTKIFTEGLKSANKLVLGEDVLGTLNVGEITKADVVRGAIFDLPFFTILLERAPAQYGDSESDLLFNEALNNAKNMLYMGVELAMTDDELKAKKYIEYIQSKEKIAPFYKERYGEEAAELVLKILDARENYLKYKNNPEKAREIFDAALRIGGLMKAKLFNPN